MKDEVEDSQEWEPAGKAARLIGKAMALQVPAVAGEVAANVVEAADHERQILEDRRANRRNRNRSYTLVVALMFTFAVPYVVANVIHDMALLKYATGIAIIPDTFITLFAWVKHY